VETKSAHFERGKFEDRLRRLRNGGSQFVRGKHVHVNDGGQAVIGNVGAPRGERYVMLKQSKGGTRTRLSPGRPTLND
jgi:hypothetical protein